VVLALFSATNFIGGDMGFARNVLILCKIPIFPRHVQGFQGFKDFFIQLPKIFLQIQHPQIAIANKHPQIAIANLGGVL
jgi:hypothetical protein